MVLKYRRSRALKPFLKYATGGLSNSVCRSNTFLTGVRSSRLDKADRYEHTSGRAAQMSKLYAAMGWVTVA